MVHAFELILIKSLEAESGTQTQFSDQTCLFFSPLVSLSDSQYLLSKMSRSFLLASLGAALTQAYTVTVSENFMNKNIDPIVFPGEYDKSHMHAFFGSDAITVDTTTSAELQAGCSSTENPNDYSIYCKLTIPVMTSMVPDGLPLYLY